MYDDPKTSDSINNRSLKSSNSIKNACDCIGSNGEKLIVPIKDRVNASCYIQTLKDHALNALDLHGIFQQDNVLAHSAEKRNFFEENAFVCLSSKNYSKFMVSSEEGSLPEKSPKS